VIASNYLLEAMFAGQRVLDLKAGCCYGPLFNEYGKRRTPILKTSRQHGARRRAREKQATPKWLTPWQKMRTKMMYERCELMNEQAGYVKYHVDHEVPLDGKLVCGLHVYWNLVIKLAAENLTKGRLTWPDMPMEQLELWTQR
jgi:hypothetical protein